ncbi:hypothetical protein [Mastigocoleus testarum]|uniref:GTPase, G3E family protein n=1 Tax=Mastigocoleus testarum BC008 TaxID=371196 RepID=A0A0V7ZQJ4_9CYAN|nr:hypothetical protein [Mastigocoleus testarum]KST66867.1 hypothetical protein BC008_27145 [Mastigocoleus testarum BC008]KST70205.1 hypothetical protein BC008_36750 [Mastigocoleus testarum BC008]
MDEEKIVVVGGYVGCGKTTWIHQQIALKEKGFPKYYKKILYFKPGTGKFQIDQKRISIDFPKVKVFGDGQEEKFLDELESADMAYIELESNLGLGYIEELLKDLPYYPVAILPPLCKKCRWHSWGKEILTGAAIRENFHQLETLRLVNTGKVIYTNSFNKLWNQITEHIYGKVIRAKGIFNLDDGRIIYTEFISDIPPIDFLELNLPRYLQGAPKRFSGLELVGFSLNEVSLLRVLEDSYLPSFGISQYQQELKSS